jgi:hypothetical protein
LLLKTGGSLARFDGRHFYVFQLGPIKTMALTEDGDLWIATADDLKKIPAVALNQYGRVPTISYHPGPGLGDDIRSLHINRLRLRQATARVTTPLEGRLAERSRIARDLHDTLLQSFQGVVFLFQGATNLLPAGAAKQKLEGVLDHAEQAIIEGRDAVHEMRSSEAASELSAAISAFAEELAASQPGNGSPTIHVRVESTPGPSIQFSTTKLTGLPSRPCAMRSSTHKRIRSTQKSSTASASFCCGCAMMAKGIDADILGHGRAGHFGLPGMRERAKLVGGSLEVRSKAGSGTEIELAIPSSIAYTKSPATRRWFFGRFRRR